LQAADHIIALQEAEHKPYLQERYPAWITTIEYWHIRDCVPTPAYNPLEEIARATRGGERAHRQEESRGDRAEPVVGVVVPGRGCCARIDPTQMAAKKAAATVARNIFITFL
jgi:hypothetical protein